MAGIKAVVLVLIVAHLFSLAITTFRLKFRHSRDRLWFDDAFAVLVVIGGLFIIGVLISALHMMVLRPIEYHINLAAYFFVLWTCRASLVMATGRLVYNTYWPNLTPLFWLVSCIFLCIGAAFTALAVRFCGMDQDCSNFETCFCNLEHTFILCALIVDILVDIATLSTNWYFFVQTQKKFGEQPDKKWLVYSGLSSNMLTLVINVTFWVSYLKKSSSENHLLFVSMSNGVMIISSMTCNSSTVVGIISGLLSSRKRSSIPIERIVVVPQAIALERIPRTPNNKIDETDNWDVASKDTALACVKGDWVV